MVRAASISPSATEQTPPKNTPVRLAATKSDKLNKTQYKERVDGLRKELEEFGDDLTIIPFSSEKGDGVEELKAVLEKYAE